MFPFPPIFPVPHPSCYSLHNTIPLPFSLPLLRTLPWHPLTPPRTHRTHAPRTHAPTHPCTHAPTHPLHPCICASTLRRLQDGLNKLALASPAHARSILNTPHRPNKRPRTDSHTPPPTSSPTRESKKRTTSFFPRGAAASTPLSACTLCLGRQPHAVATCNAARFWDDSAKTHCSRNDRGRLINPGGTIICSDWQKPNGCASSSSSHLHECSGCGKKDHGAQSCPRAQKV